MLPSLFPDNHKGRLIRLNLFIEKPLDNVLPAMWVFITAGYWYCWYANHAKYSAMFSGVAGIKE